MNTQNILNSYGLKLDIKLDSSEFYDYDLDTNQHDYNKDLLDLTKPIFYERLIIDSNCLNSNINDVKPWENEINVPYQMDNCDFTVRRRTELGWTISMVFNKQNLLFEDGKTFYYWGIKNEFDERNFVDNNLSFSFTDDGKILWESYRYSGFCDNVNGYTEDFYHSSGSTPTLCTDGVLNDFNITIVFKRNFYLEDCDIPNDGGWNDLIINRELVTELNDWISGTTTTYIDIEDLNKKWAKERNYRLGTLRIYLNGNPIYKLDNWEEIVPSKRNSTNPIVQIFGGGSNGFFDIYKGDTLFDVLDIKYIEQPFNPLEVKHFYLTRIKPQFNISECGDKCFDNVYRYVENGVLTENDEQIITEDNNLIIF